MNEEVFTVDQTVEEDGQVHVAGLPIQRGDEVEVTVRLKQPKRTLRGISAAEILASGFVGIWADREEMRDSQAYARALREEAETRDWSDDDSAGQ